MDQSAFYNQIAGVYDVMINWEKRLAREGPFFQKIFQERSVRIVLDSAAAGGRHVRYFQELGYTSHGSDFSAEMIAECRRTDPTHSADYFVSDFRELATKTSPPYDSAVCLGCSLPHLPTERDFSKALDNFAAILKPGGVLITQFVNFDKITKSGERIRPLNHTVRADGEYFFLRVYDFISLTEMVIHLNILIKRGMDWEWKTQSTTLFPIPADTYLKLLEQAGFRDIQCYGDYTMSTYEEDTSSDLVVVTINS